jgi:hypothetical protein
MNLSTTTTTTIAVQASEQNRVTAGSSVMLSGSIVSRLGDFDWYVT